MSTLFYVTKLNINKVYKYKPGKKDRQGLNCNKTLTTLVKSIRWWTRKVGCVEPWTFRGVGKWLVFSYHNIVVLSPNWGMSTYVLVEIWMWYYSSSKYVLTFQLSTYTGMFTNVISKIYTKWNWYLSKRCKLLGLTTFTVLLKKSGNTLLQIGTINCGWKVTKGRCTQFKKT